jgi:hypothetical protein
MATKSKCTKSCPVAPRRSRKLSAEVVELGEWAITRSERQWADAMAMIAATNAIDLLDRKIRRGRSASESRLQSAPIS